MARKNEKTLVALGEEELSSVAGGFFDMHNPNVVLTQTNLSADTLLAAGIIGGPVYQATGTVQGNGAVVNA